MMMTSGAAPCVSCGTEGGFVQTDCHRPARPRGLCMRCYLSAYTKGTLEPLRPFHERTIDHPTPWPNLNDVTATGAMLWTNWQGERQQHAVYPSHFDAKAEIAEARHDAARWLMTHPMTNLLIWPDPSLALFGAANAERAA